MNDTFNTYEKSVIIASMDNNSYKSFFLKEEKYSNRN